ncbi:MAG: hypothetical protein ACHQ4J_05850 [Candidatus Binatia bacterium]
MEESSGNIFADLGFPNPEREEIKARLTFVILPATVSQFPTYAVACSDSQRHGTRRVRR